MKKIFTLLVGLLLCACASSDAYVMQNCTISDCEITSVHHHVW